MDDLNDTKPSSALDREVQQENAASDIAAKIETPAIATNAPAPTSFAILAQSLIDRVLYFLSHASNETIGACLVGLSASTYLLLGRIGLLFIGIAGGVVLQATWEGVRIDDRDEKTKREEQERRREASIDVIRRVLDYRTLRGAANTRSEDVKVFANRELDYSEFSPETEKALNVFTDAIIKDYVRYWYEPTIPGEETFPKQCRRTLTAFFLSLGGHLGRKRPADVLLDFLSNSSSIIVVFLTELAAALNASPNITAEEAISSYISSKPDSSLSYMLDQESQTEKLADVSEDILQAYLDPKAYNCPPIHAFLKEVLAQLVLGYTVTLCSEPNWINDWIVYGLEESKTTKEVMGLVDAGVEGKPLPLVPETPTESATEPTPTIEATQRSEMKSEHRRTRSKAEISMDEAMEEARRLTALMIAEDERVAREERERVEAARDMAEQPNAATQNRGGSESHSNVEEESILEPVTQDNMPREEPPPVQFTSFDQLTTTAQPTALMDEPQIPAVKVLENEEVAKEAVALTLHNASITIFDDSVPGERSSIKAKPTTDYMIQIEPALSIFSGWMIPRKYADFETLHEILRRISVISGVPFAHVDLPKWRNNTKASLRTELERYLCDAMRLQPLAESEGMKRFLDKDRGLTKSGGKGFGWPTPDAFGKIGGDMMSVLTKAPKQVAGGGKAVFGGMAGLVTNGIKLNGSQSNIARSEAVTISDKPALGTPAKERASFGSPLTDSVSGDVTSERESQETQSLSSSRLSNRRGSVATTASEESRALTPATPSRPFSLSSQSQLTPATEQSPESSIAGLRSASTNLEQAIHLPPPPSEMPEDYDAPSAVGKKSMAASHASIKEPTNDDSNDLKQSTSSLTMPQYTIKKFSKPTPPPADPLTERETAITIELIFALITHLYTLSPSTWSLRRTLLTAAKTFLLRPGNPQLLSIRTLIQTSLLDANLSDAGLASQIYHLRENALPTADETEAWKAEYPQPTDEQKIETRTKARKLLVTKGMPQALTSVMGAAASGEALGKVFDALQTPGVARGLVTGLLLQALKVITN
ncbi:uncharacterized protein K489DRAFT_384854 [Dissoconium aciculare CBS 342.82]|uniref:PXA domain-containing protein n=1 Tax=Dissoconium aciculare CBS 342.82 TaxID=1314786 RepID=A0A6J3LT17_9PEZI|nr:uncharacterized protein K489DRAFT_384854 [Dissoconium aciculare CBS 342.82]KAF1818429.1 hypothetical protein K489DRAFT_384854 [Dissoconium aciculare CBS 342.82]